MFQTILVQMIIEGFWDIDLQSRLMWFVVHDDCVVHDGVCL